MAKWVADAMFIEGIYDLLIELKEYPFLESRKEYVHTMTIMDVTEHLSKIDLDESMTIGKLRHKLDIINAMGYGEDGGFPILSHGDILEGYIATTEVSHVLQKLEKTLDPIMDEYALNNVSCYFNKVGENDIHQQEAPVERLFETTADDLYEDIETMIQKQSLNDFSQYVDHVSCYYKFL